MKDKLDTYATNTWCPGCGNFGLQRAIKSALAELEGEGMDLHRVVIVTGIGCHGKIADYLDLNSFYSLHGRAVPAAAGMKLANTNLLPVVCVGDGDVYGEGLEHLVFAAKRNSDIKVLVHDNRVYGLTTGQFTPTSPKHFQGRSTPKGSVEEPLNPIELMLASGASFVARGYAGRQEHLKNLVKRAIAHRGFGIVDILQPCFTYFNTYNIYNEKVYEMEESDLGDLKSAFEKAREWDYRGEGVQGRIPLGIFYKSERKTFEEEMLARG